jgi:hypothetical protein
MHIQHPQVVEPVETQSLLARLVLKHQVHWQEDRALLAVAQVHLVVFSKLAPIKDETAMRVEATV